MSHEVESLFYTREKPWRGLGTIVAEAPTSADALRLAGLNWNVESRPIFDDRGKVIPNYKANTRDSDNSVLGIVSGRYKIVSNVEAFEFTDALIGGDVRYETAGSLFCGKKIWLLAKMPEVKVVGDIVEPYLCFTNTHDGSGAVRVCMTPVRVVCNNTLNLALNRAKRAWSVKHIGDITYRLDEARLSLELAEAYMDELDVYGTRLANTPVGDAKVRDILNELFPVSENSTERIKGTASKIKDEFMVCYNMQDIRQFYGTAWGVINAMVDMANHTAPQRQTENYRENNWDRIINGHHLVDKTFAALTT